MPSQDKLIKQGIRYTDRLFEEIIKRLEQGVLSSDTLEAFLEKTKEYTTANPLVTTGYDSTMLNLILSETNNYKFSRPSQRELVRVTIENRVGELIQDVGEDIKQNVRDIAKEEYNKGSNPVKIAKQITAKVDGIKNKRARTIARTEVARASTVSDYVINKERGATGFTVSCRSTRCAKCKEAFCRDSATGGDVEYGMDDVSVLPPLHPNCRCSVEFTFDLDKFKGKVSTQKPTTTTTTEPVENTEPTNTEYGGKKLSASELKERLGERKYVMFQKSSADIIKWSKQMEKLKPDDSRRLMLDGRIYGAIKSLDRLEKEALNPVKKVEYPISVETPQKVLDLKEELGAKKVYSETTKRHKHTYDVYEFDGFTVAMDRELFTNHLVTVKEIRDHMMWLPKELRTTGARITISNVMDLEAQGYYWRTEHEVEMNNNDNRYVKSKEGYNELGMEIHTILDAITHEVAHSYDLKNFHSLKGNIASKEVWGAICKEDNKLYKYRDERTGRMRTPKKFPTTYASESWYKASRSDNYDKKATQYCEDFAESTKLYLNPRTHKKFVREFPNRAKFLKEHFGEPDFENCIIESIKVMK